jgi:hypothetical protein
MSEPEDNQESNDNIEDKDDIRKSPEYRAFERILKRVVSAPPMRPKSVLLKDDCPPE